MRASVARLAETVAVEVVNLMTAATAGGGEPAE
jgi:hypothetical protein